MTVQVELTQVTDILMAADNIDWADQMEEWRNNPDNQNISKAGDDRTPPYTWHGCLNFDHEENGIVTIPSEYIMRSLMSGAAEIPIGKGRKTFKSQSQSGILCLAEHWPLLIKGQPIKMASINALRRLGFRDQCEAVKLLGFRLYVKRVAMPGRGSKHVRVRPRFTNWSTVGALEVIDSEIKLSVLQKMFDIAGRRKGLGNWRPSAPKSPGPFGTFTCKLTEI